MKSSFETRKRRLELIVIISEILVVFFGIAVAVGVVGEWKSASSTSEKEFSIPVAIGVIGEVLFGIVTLAGSEMAKVCQTAIDDEKERKIGHLESRLATQESHSAYRSLTPDQRDALKLALSYIPPPKVPCLL